MPFDPDAFLAANVPPGGPQPGGPPLPPPPEAPSAPAAPFDPDAFLAANVPPSPSSVVPSNTKENAPQQAPDPVQAPDEETPGVLQALKNSYTRSLSKQLTNEMLGVQVLAGQKNLNDLATEAIHGPEVKDAIDRLNEKNITEGWTSIPWWMAKTGSALGSITPGLGYAIGASAVTSPVGGIAAFAGEAALSNIVPTYIQAKREGLTDDQALNRAIVDSGIAATFAGAMGMAGKFPLTGTMMKEVEGVATKVLKRPTAEFMAQFGLVQPTLMASQDIATSLAEGKGMPGPADLATDMVIGTVAGLGVHSAFKGMDKVKGIGTDRSDVPATEASIAAAMETQRFKGAELPKPGAEPAAPSLPLVQQEQQGEALDAPAPRYDRDPVTREPQPVWYSQVGRIIDEKMPSTASAEQVMGILRNGGIPQEMMDRSYIANYLEDQRGQINKSDLLAHIEANAIKINEFQTSDAPRSERARGTMPLEHEQAYNWLPGEQQGRRELVMYTDDPIDQRTRQIAEQMYGPGAYDKLSPEQKRGIEKTAKLRLREENEGQMPPVSTDIAHWPSIMNPIAHVRNEVRQSPTGQQTLINVETQSIHQEGARLGYIGQQHGDAEKLMATLSPLADKVRAMRARYLPPDQRVDRLEQTDWSRIPLTPTDKQLLQQYRTAHNEWKKALTTDQEREAHVSLPFKSDWQDLAVKRLLRYAADNGFPELGFVNGDIVGLRLADAKELNGARTSYNNIWKLAKKWANKLGMEYEVRRLTDVTPEAAAENFYNPAQRLEQFKKMGLIGAKPFDNSILVLKLNPMATDAIRKGMPYSKPLQRGVVGGRTLTDVMRQNPNAAHLMKPAAKIEKMINLVANQLGVRRGIEFRAKPMPGEDWYGRMLPDINPATGNYQIEVNLSHIMTERDLYASMSHEFGHVVMTDFYDASSPAEKAALKKAHQDFMAKIPSDQMTVGAVRMMRDNFVGLQSGARALHDGVRLSDLDPNSKQYFLSFEEWFAEQTSKWMTTDAKPMGVVEKFFKRLSNGLKKMFGIFTKSHPGLGTPDQAVADYLNNRWASRPAMVEPIQEQFDMDTKKKAKEAFAKEGAPETTAVPQDASGNGGRAALDAMGLGKDGEAIAAHGDRMNWFFKLMLSLPQIQQLNKHIPELAYYTNMHDMANTIKNQLAALAQRRMEQWAAIRDSRQLTSLTKFIDEYANGLFKLPHTEDGIFRRPNAEEFAALVKKHGLSDQSVKLFQGLVTDFDGFLERYRQLLINDALKLTDPVRRANSMTNINTKIDKVLQRPFMPMTRFGKYLITVYDANGTVRHSEQTNTLRRQRQIVEALEKSPDRLPGDQVLPGMVPKDATPFLGMPPGMIDLLADKLSLSDTQRAVIDQLRFDYAPGHSFKHQFRTLDLTPGYSTDFRRNYAHFFFHGANHVTRVQFGDQMRDMINRLTQKEVRLQRAGNTDGANKLDKIVDYMNKHYEAWVNPKNDWAATRGMMFHWYLGFNPAAALNNLTQTPLMTYPWLASKFGDFKAIKALVKASTSLQNFYRKGTIQAAAPKPGEANTPANFLARASNEAIDRGTISETQAHQLAAVSEDRNLLQKFGTKGEQAWIKFNEASSWMFETSEQYNRRVAFHAALDLAYTHPDHKMVKEAIQAQPLLFQELVKEKGWTQQEAGAFVAAKQAVSATQFDYAPWARPPAFRGGLAATALVFKLFTQNTLFNLASNPGMLWRWMLVMGVLGGTMGLPGMENANSFLKTMAYRLFGKDFDLEDEGRKFAADVTNGVIPPDILMHGLSSQGFGLPAVMHSMGVNWFPTFDMSKSVGMGNVLPADPFKPLGPVLEPQKETLRQIQNAVGAAFGLPMSLYDFSTSNDNLTDMKKYEMIMPRFLGNLSHSFRYLTQGAEVNRAGNQVVRFNVGDTEQMMEILGRAAGLQPRRLTEEWGRISARAQNSAYLELRRQGLMRQFAEAVKTQSEDDKDRVIDAIKDFNRKLEDPQRGYAISSEALRNSVQKRLRGQALQESGLPLQKRDIPLAQELEKYYPRGWPRDLENAKGVR